MLLDIYQNLNDTKLLTITIYNELEAILEG